MTAPSKPREFLFYSPYLNEIVIRGCPTSQDSLFEFIGHYLAATELSFFGFVEIGEV